MTDIRSGVLPRPGGVPPPPRGLLPALAVVYGSAAIGKWLYDRWSDGDGEPLPVSAAPNGWTTNWVCSIDPKPTDQWSLNIGGPTGPVNPACLSGQAIDSLVRPLGETVPGTHGIMWWVTSAPIAPASPYRLVREWTKATPTDGEVPLPWQPVAINPPKRIAWVGSIATRPGEIVGFPRSFGYARSSARDLPISEFVQTSIHGPRTWRRAANVAWSPSGAAVRAHGKSWVVARTRAGTYTIKEVIPRLDAKAKTAPPGPRQKEQKLKITAGRTLQRLLSLSTEAADMIEALHDALDKECMRERAELRRHTRRLYVSERFVARFLKQAKTPQAKLRDIWQFFDCLDGGEALKNIGLNEIQDRLLGRGAKHLRSAQQYATRQGYLPDKPGFQVGPWDTLGRDNRASTTRADLAREGRDPHAPL